MLLGESTFYPNRRCSGTADPYRGPIAGHIIRNHYLAARYGRFWRQLLTLRRFTSSEEGAAAAAAARIPSEDIVLCETVVALDHGLSLWFSLSSSLVLLLIF